MQKPTSDDIRDALNLATALATATNARFMAPEHGATIWKHYLKNSSIDVPKDKTIKKDAKKA